MNDAVEIVDSLSIMNLAFKDMYIRVDEECSVDQESRYNPSPGPGVDPYHCLVVPDQYKEDIHQLRKRLLSHKTDNFSTFWNNVRMRVCRFHTVSKENADTRETWCCLRRFPTRFPELEKLKLKESDLSVIKSQGKRLGLIVICGGTGAGKTTTGIAAYRYYLTSIGGVGYMIEDPVEYVMQGAFDAAPDTAFVLQREVSEDHEWSQAIKDGLRSNPKFVYLGEVRSPDSASQMLRMANSGHLVMCTVHGSSVEQGISALVQIARSQLGELANQLLADCLSLICYQKMTPDGPVVTLMEAKGLDDPVREHIRENKLKMLSGAIEQQANVAKSKVNAAAKAGVSTTPTRRPPPKPPVKKKGWF